MRFPFILFRVTGKSMEPLFHEGDYVLVSRIAYTFSLPRKNDVVIIKHPITNRLLLKRIVRVGGPTYSVKGDNQKLSTDSRQFGFVTKEQIVGKVWRKIVKK